MDSHEHSLTFFNSIILAPAIYVLGALVANTSTNCYPKHHGYCTILIISSVSAF